MPKLKARSRRKPPNKPTTSLTSTTKLSLKPIRPKSPKFETKNQKLKTKNITPRRKVRFRVQNNSLKFKIHLPTVVTKLQVGNLKFPSINPKLFSLSLLLYFLLFLFLDQVPPEKVANIPLYQAYLPFHLTVFLANLTLLSSFLSSNSAFLTAFFIQSLTFFKLQGFKVEPRLTVSLALLTLALGFMNHFFKKLGLSRKLKSLKLPKKSTRLRRRHRPRSRLAR